MRGLALAYTGPLQLTGNKTVSYLITEYGVQQKKNLNLLAFGKGHTSLFYEICLSASLF
jgi:hypothetical protein